MPNSKCISDILKACSVLPALVVCVASADTVGNWTELTSAVSNATGVLGIDFGGDITANDSKLTFLSGTDVSINGAGNTYSGRQFAMGSLVKESETNYYKYEYTNDNGETAFLYSYKPNLSTGGEVWLTPDMSGESLKIDYRYSTFVGFAGQGTDVIYTRNPDGDVVNSKGKQVYAFVAQDGTVVYSSTEKLEDATSLPTFFSDASLASSGRVYIKNVSVNPDGGYIFTIAGGLSKVNTSYIAQPFEKYNVGGIDFYVKPGLDLDSDMDVYNSALLKANADTKRLVHNEDGTVSLILGGAIRADAGAKLTINNLVIDNIYTRASGGAMSVGGNLYGDNIKFMSNISTAEGGALYVDKTGIIDMGDNVSFESNYAGTNGGGISLAANSTAVLGNNAAFVGNSAMGSSGRGGAVMLNSATSFTVGDNAVFTDNYSTQKGGAIYAWASKEASAVTVKIGDNALFRNNTSAEQYAGALYLADYTNFSLGGGARFISNKAFAGGAIFYSSLLSDLNLDNALFADNSALQGGAIVFGGADAKNQMDKNLNITGSTFSGNFATGNEEQSSGGAIFISSAAIGTISISDSVFDGNYSTLVGGAIIQANESTATLNIANTDFSGNYTMAEGGALISDAVLNITGGSFVENKTTRALINEENPLYTDGGGGAIFMYDHSQATISGGTKFIGNSAGSYGGAIATRINASAQNSWLDISDVVFTGNSAGIMGGAIYNTVAMTLSGENIFSGNTAAGKSNDIHNIGTMTIANGTTIIDGGITGPGEMTIADGATLDIGTAIIEQGTVNIDGTLRAAALNSDEFGQVITDSMNVGNDALLNLTVGSVGTYKIFNLDNDIAIDAGTAYVAQNNGADGIVITTRAVEDIAANAGVSTVAAGAIAGLANSGDATLNIASLNAQLALARGDTDYIEAEAAKAHPEQKPVAHSVATSVQNQVLTLAANRMSLVGPAAGRNGGDINADYGVWAQGLFNKSKFGSQFHGYTRGVAFGADAQIERDYVLGLGYSFSNTDVHSTGRHTDIDSHTLFLYSQYKPAAWYINSTLNYTLSKYDESFTAFGVPFSDKHDVDTFGAQVAAGYDFISGITPEVGLRYLYITQDDYNNGLARVKGVDSNFLTGMAGLKYAFTIKNDAAIKWRPELRAAATYDFVSDDVQTTVLMPGAAPYVVDGDRLSRFGGEFGLGLTAMWRGLELSVIYDLDLHEDYTSQTGMLKFRYEF